MHSQPALKGLCGRLSGVRCMWHLKQPHNRNKRSTLIPTVCCFKGQCTPFCEFRLTAGCGIRPKKEWLWRRTSSQPALPPPPLSQLLICAGFFMIFSRRALIVSSRALKPFSALCFCAVGWTYAPEKRTASVRVASAHHVLPTW